MNLKEALAAPITSKEAFDAILLAASSSNRSLIGRPKSDVYCENRYEVRPWRFYEGTSRVEYVYPNSVQVPSIVNTVGDSGYYVHHSRWWVLREQLRVGVGLYDRSQVVNNMSHRFLELGIHSKPGHDDPAAVFYTHDHEGGQRDQQVMTTLGRLMRKLYPHVDDATLRDLEASHRAEMLNEVEFIPPDQISSTYPGCGTTSCMTHTADKFAATGGIHPTEVYNAPGFTMAVSRRDGRIIGRTLCWENPDDPSDKRYIRSYGDTALIQRLVKRGFRYAGLEGVRLKKVPLPKQGENCYLMAYLDNTAPELNGTTVALDGEWLRVLTSKQFAALDRQRVRAPSGRVTSGFLVVQPECTVDRCNIKCAISGRPILENEASVRVLIGGEPKLARTDEAARLACEGWKIFLDATGQSLLCPPDTPAFSVDGNTFIDNDDMRERLGFLRLDLDLYPGSEWVRYASYPQVYKSLATDDESLMYIRKDDGVHIIVNIDGTPVMRRCHKSLAEGLRRVRNVHGSIPAYAAEGVEVVKTAKRWLAVPGVHAVYKTIDGVWDHERNLTTFRFMGGTYYIQKGVVAISEATAPALIADRVGAFRQGVEYTLGEWEGEDLSSFENQQRFVSDLCRHFQRMLGSSYGLIASGSVYLGSDTYSRCAAVNQMRILRDTVADPASKAEFLRNHSFEYATTLEVQCQVIDIIDSAVKLVTPRSTVVNQDDRSASLNRLEAAGIDTSRFREAPLAA